MKFIVRLAVLTVIFMSSISGICSAENPEDLNKWKDFLVYGEEKYLCVPEFSDDSRFHCTWPGVLNLEIHEDKILFSQKITLLTDSYVRLPGNLENFPVHVKKDGSLIPVTIYNKAPACFPGKGEFNITGEIPFSNIPDFINLPDFSGGCRIVSKTDRISSPYTDSGNILWLKKDLSGSERLKEHIRISVFRKIKDSLPCEIESVYKINVSGSTRQERISTGNIPGQIAYVNSPLPLKIEKNGSFIAQVKPGEYEISIKNIVPYMPSDLGPFNSGYTQEIIALEKEPGVRISNIKNLKTIDPKNTDIPDSWKKFPAYILLPGEKIVFEETVKGILSQQPEVKLEREIWLDFNGKGATIRDQIKGKLYRRTFMGISNESGIAPGKISLNERDQIITEKNSSAGVPVNEGSFLLESVSRKDSSPKIFPTGWNMNFSEISGYINIPPAFDILSVSGAKLSGNHTFISKWTLLDIFVLCILFISALKIWNIKWGIIFFICAGAVYHKFYLPPYVWIFLVICSGILNSKQLKKFFLQKNFFRISFYFIYFSCLLTVFCAAIIFSAQNIKYSVYPSLDSPSQSYRSYSFTAMKQKKVSETDSYLSERSSMVKQRLSDRARQLQMEMEEPVYQTIKNDYEYTQTGTGIPSWNNRKIRFENASQDKMTIYVLPPFAVRAVYLLNVFFLFVLLLKLIPFKKIFSNLKPVSSSGTAAAVFIIMAVSVFQPQKASAQYPPEHLLKEYKQRLLNEKKFDHQLAVIEHLTLNASKSGGGIKLEMIFRINAERDCAVFLPATKDLEYDNIYLDSKNHDYILKKQNKTLTFVPEGIHSLKIIALSKKDEMELKFDMMPLRLSFNSDGIESKGIENKGFSPLIKLFIPAGKNEKNTLKGVEGAFPFPVVERNLYLGREWKIRTAVKRFYPQNNDKKAEVSIPLLKNEKILRETGEIKNNRLDVTLLPGVNSFEFESEIPVGQNIEITSDKNMFHLEKWTVDSDSLKDFEIKGLIPVKYSTGNQTVFAVEPGTNGVIAPHRLKPVKGRFFTIDKIDLLYDISKTKNTLAINSVIRAGKGLDHKITYDSSRLFPEQLTINKIKNQIPEINGELALNLSPGENSINIVFSEKNKARSVLIPGKIDFPEINFNAQSVNITQELKYPYKSWIIAAFGPRKGPAVLFWGYFAGVVLAAAFLAKFTRSFLKPHQFILLAAGLSLAAPLEIIIVFGFFFAVEYRKNLVPEETRYFNLIQTGIIFLLIMSAGIIYDAVSSGLLGIPDMQIAGNGSYSGSLKWFSDKSENIIPSAFVILAPINLWKLILFLWSLWISAFLINKTPYIIDSLKHEGFWKKSSFLERKKKK
ncbi:MAG: hypothetical protein AB7E04_09935 [Desulfobacteraceae bacterium]